MQENQQLIEEKAEPTLKVGLVGFKNMTASALSHYLQSERSADVVILDAYRKPTAGTNEAADLDVVVIDASRRSLKELDSWKVIGPRNDGPKMAVYCEDFDSNFAWAALRHGADGVISGDANVESLPSILELIASGQVFVPSSIIASGSVRGDNESGRDNPLNDMETTTLRMIAEGHINKEIALALDVTEMHVKLIVRNICRALDAKNRSHAVAKAIQWGLI